MKIFTTGAGSRFTKRPPVREVFGSSMMSQSIQKLGQTLVVFNKLIWRTLGVGNISRITPILQVPAVYPLPCSLRSFAQSAAAIPIAENPIGEWPRKRIEASEIITAEFGA